MAHRSSSDILNNEHAFCPQGQGKVILICSGSPDRKMRWIRSKHHNLQPECGAYIPEVKSSHPSSRAKGERHSTRSSSIQDAVTADSCIKSTRNTVTLSLENGTSPVRMKEVSSGNTYVCRPYNSHQSSGKVVTTKKSSSCTGISSASVTRELSKQTLSIRSGTGREVKRHRSRESATRHLDAKHSNDGLDELNASYRTYVHEESEALTIQQDTTEAKMSSTPRSLNVLDRSGLSGRGLPYNLRASALPYSAVYNKNKNDRGAAAPRTRHLPPREEKVGDKSLSAMSNVARFSRPYSKSQSLDKTLRSADRRGVSNIKRSARICRNNAFPGNDVGADDFEQKHSSDAPNKGSSIAQRIFHANRGKISSFRHESRVGQFNRYSQQNAPGARSSLWQNDKIKVLVSTSAQYSDTEIKDSCCQPNIKSDNGDHNMQLKRQQCSVDQKGSENKAPSSDHQDFAECPSVSAKNKASNYRPHSLSNSKSLSSGGTGHSSSNSLKCNSFLSEILKEVAEQMLRPNFETDSREKRQHRHNLSKQLPDNPPKSEQDGAQQPYNIKIPASMLAKDRCADVALLNEVLKTPAYLTGNDQALKSCLCDVEKASLRTSKTSAPGSVKRVGCYNVQNSKTEATSSGSGKKENEEIQSSHSTVSLEVKSVKVNVFCAEKHHHKNSRQIQIRLALSPHTRTQWRTEQITFEDMGEQQKHKSDTQYESVSEFDSTEFIETKSELLADKGKCISKTENIGLGTSAQEDLIKKAGACEQATGPRNFTSATSSVSEINRGLCVYHSDTVLTSPPPSKVGTYSHTRGRSKSKAGTFSLAKSPELNSDCFLTPASHLDKGQKRTLRIPNVGSQLDPTQMSHRKNRLRSTVSKVQCNNIPSESETRYRHKSAVKILARKPETNLVPGTDDRYLLLQLDWGVFITAVTTIPVLLFLLSLNFYFRAVQDDVKATGLESQASTKNSFS